ncbi:MAG: hypothetical protein CMF69_06820 [Magnetovibrio sp.]|nr:hypothetical protein [Magnetovibrio sp.]|tara:strand:- start:60 stop:1052 length:993 start_codon:yes stop_codon:yes gene_type:complete
MNYRKLGHTDINISEIGFGAWGIGGVTPGPTSYGRTDDSVSIGALNKAFELGINFYDTANVYGNGHSEILIGQTFHQKRTEVVISTKVGCVDFRSPLNFDSGSILETFEGSLRRLKTDYIDLLMLHDPVPEEHEIAEAFDQLMTLKQAGKLRALGISVRNPVDCQYFLDNYAIDALQVNFNLMDHRILELNLLESAMNKGCSIIARTPLCFGFLTDAVDGYTKFDKDDHRSRWPESQRIIWLQGRDLFKSELNCSNTNDIALNALRFCISFDNIASVIPGIISPDEATFNVKASIEGPLSSEEVNGIQQIYKETKFFSKRPVGKTTMAEY